MRSVGDPDRCVLDGLWQMGQVALGYSCERVNVNTNMCFKGYFDLVVSLLNVLQLTLWPWFWVSKCVWTQRQAAIHAASCRINASSSGEDQRCGQNNSGTQASHLLVLPMGVLKYKGMIQTLPHQLPLTEQYWHRVWSCSDRSSVLPSHPQAVR